MLVVLRVALVVSATLAVKLPSCVYYRGNGVTKTLAGIECQPWSVDEPHEVNNLVKGFGMKWRVKQGNACRSGIGPDTSGLWCYTSDIETRYGYCNNTDICSPIKPKELPPCSQYKGLNLTTTMTGETCQPWADDAPHKPNSQVQNLGNGWRRLQGNACRSGVGPHDYTGLWCYTTNSTKRWEYCDYSHVCTAAKPEGLKSCAFYDGHDISKTISGKTCQEWSDNFPHTPSGFVIGLGDIWRKRQGNACRSGLSTDDYTGLWCYTNDTNTRWEYCEYKDFCSTGVPEGLKSCSTYKGMVITKTVSGKVCQNWADETPHMVGDSITKLGMDWRKRQGNACRAGTSAKDKAGLWCYTSDPDTRWEFCDSKGCSLTKSKVSCAHYRGKDINKTKSGETCQPWKANFPHKPSGSVEGYGMEWRIAQGNACRNGLSEEDYQGLWCYTSDVNQRWEYCDYEDTCTATPPEGLKSCALYDQFDIQTTVSGKPCQRWSSTSPHMPNVDVRLEGMDWRTEQRNACRDGIGQSFGGLWCYTTDATTRWERCDFLSVCKTGPPPTA